MTFRLLSALNFFLCSVAITGAAENFSVETRDKFQLQLLTTGQIAGIHSGGKVIAARNFGGFSLRDASKRGRFNSMTGLVVRAKGGLHFQGNAEAWQLKIEASFLSTENYLAVDGVVQNIPASERCVDLKFTLPIDARGWRWGTDLVGEDLIQEKISGLKTSDDITVYPVAAISNQKLGTGISLAVPPTHPTLFETGADANGLFVIFKIGLSPATSPPNQTPFKLILYRHDPAWGFRSALDRYYGFFREPYFARRVKRIGAWYWSSPKTSQIKNPKLYAFHEGGNEDAQIVPEMKNAIPPFDKTVGDFEKRCEFALDEKLGMYSLPYTMVGQRQIYGLPDMPKDSEEALAVFEKWTTDKPIVFQSNGPANGFRNVEQLKEIIRNSGVYDEKQKPAILLREYMGNTATFPLNPNPKLFFDSGKMTIAKYSLDDYLPMLFGGSKFIDGFYVDSLGRWPGYYNFRREHFKYSTVPLTYHGNPPQPCLWNAQSHAEYLSELSRRLHEQEKILFANGIHANRVMLGFYVDAMGMEGLPDFHNRDGFYSTRVAAATKPYCALNAHDSAKPSVWNSCLYLGILIGAHSEKTRALEEKFLPAIIQLNQAGWQPITLAHVDSAKVGVERWGGGDGSPVYFSFLNRSKDRIETTVRVEANPLKIGKNWRLTHLLSEESIASSRKNDDLIFKIILDPETAAAICVGE